jgi:hypothetical protein
MKYSLRSLMIVVLTALAAFLLMVVYPLVFRAITAA